MAEQNDHAYELRQLMENLTEAFEKMGEAARESMDAMAASLSPPAVEPEDPRVFQHTDHDGDHGTIRRGNWNGGELYVQMPSLYLDQDAVNRLARFLDQHRTDATVVHPNDPAPPIPCSAGYRLGNGLAEYCELDVHGEDVAHSYGDGALRWTSMAPNHYWREPDGELECGITRAHDSHQYANAGTLHRCEGRPRKPDPECGITGRHGFHNYARNGQWRRCEGQS